MYDNDEITLSIKNWWIWSIQRLIKIVYHEILALLHLKKKLFLLAIFVNVLNFRFIGIVIKNVKKRYTLIGYWTYFNKIIIVDSLKLLFLLIINLIDVIDLEDSDNSCNQAPATQYEKTGHKTQAYIQIEASPAETTRCRGWGSTIIKN